MKGYLKLPLLVVALCILTAVSQTDARADNVTFSTAGVFNCSSCAGSGSNSVTFMGSIGNATMITFTGVNAVTVNTSPSGMTFTSFGQIQTMASGTGATITPGTTLSLTITQSLPNGGSGSFSALLSGAIVQNSSTGLVTFTVTHVQIGNVGYDVDASYKLVPPATQNGVTTFQGSVSTGGVSTPTAAVPEPSAMILFGSGLLGAAGAFRRQYRLSRKTNR